MIAWHHAVTLVAPSIVQIETPSGYGTGFLFSYNESKTWIAIATARHVVQEADKRQQPIGIHNVEAGTTVLIHQRDRVILPDSFKDSAALLIPAAKLTELRLPEKPIPLLPTGYRLRVGVEVAWLGYPGIGADSLCFFRGAISAWEKDSPSYLIDGVAINGVSGGPVMHRLSDSDTIQIVGAITAYRPNRTCGATLPGLSIAQDLSHLHKIVAELKTIETCRI
jgi:Trypsin-like peptidase domain